MSHKPYAKKMEGVAVHYDSLTDGYCNGHSIVTCGMHSLSQGLIPFDEEIYIPKQATKNEIACYMIERLCRFKKPLCLVMDTWYSNGIVIGKLKERGIRFVTQIKSNRNVTISMKKRFVREQSRIVSILIFLLFRADVSYKTICDWTKKFNGKPNIPQYRYSDKDILICHADEKFVKINGEWHYWWSIKDCFGNLIYCLVTEFRDFISAKNLLRTARRRIGRDVDILVRDGLHAYDSATKFLGRRCKNVVAGINGKPFILNKHFYLLTNATLKDFL